MITLLDLKTYLRDNVEETEFLELLDITTEDLILAFDDRITEKFDLLVSNLELEEDATTSSNDIHTLID